MEKAAEINTPGTRLDLSKEKIVQFSLGVKDRDKVAKRFSRIFGIHWKLFELNLRNKILHSKESTNTIPVWQATQSLLSSSDKKTCIAPVC